MFLQRYPIRQTVKDKKKQRVAEKKSGKKNKNKRSLCFEPFSVIPRCTVHIPCVDHDSLSALVFQRGYCILSVVIQEGKKTKKKETFFTTSPPRNEYIQTAALT